MNEELDRPVLETFSKCLGDDFEIQLDNQTINMRLVEATELPPATSRTDLGIRQDPFSLIFKVDDGMQLQQRIYELKHKTIGTTIMFIVPVGFGEYQAIFN